MATLADSLISSASRPVTLRMRPDLQARRHRYHGRTYWVVKEPIGLNYFRFHEEEYAILCMLDGHSSLERIKEDFEQDFAPQKITYQDLQQFVGMLHRSGLVIADAVGQGRQLRKRRDERKRKELLGKFTNVFALRFRGIDPERVLNWMIPYTAWLFKSVTVIFFMMLGLAALTLVAVQFDVFRSRLPTFHEFFGPHNWLYMGITLGLVKVLHEFGHGLSCKYFGGECHEMGVMLLVFTPCLYCNVSDSWMLPNKWHRVFIGAAGMYVELILASVATFVWWFSEPGLLNHIALSIMFICSVSTVMFNGNPLLRFDGYYILMDIAEIPNLRQKSSEVLKRFMTQLCLGIEQPENPFLPQKHRFFFGLYTVAAVIYRWVVVLSIIIFLNKVLEPYGLKVIGQFIALVGLFGLIVQPLWNLGKFFYTPGRMHKVKRHRVMASLAVAAGLILLVLFVPLPHHVDCVLEVAPSDAQAVYADVPGRLEEVFVKPGQRVEAGAPLARLENLDLRLTVVKLEGERNQTAAHLNALRHQRFHVRSAALQIDQLSEALVSLDKQLTEKRAELERLDVTAPQDGTVLPPPLRPRQKDPGGQLPQWSGSPFEPRNQGALLAPSDLLCRVGNPKALEALMVIDQADIELVRRNTQTDEWPEVEIKLEAYPGETIESHIVQISNIELKVTPARLSTQAGGSLDTRTDPSGVQRPMSTSYHARAPLPDAEGKLRVGLRGYGKIYTGWQTLGSRLYRYVARTFHFQL